RFSPIESKNFSISGWVRPNRLVLPFDVVMDSPSLKSLGLASGYFSSGEKVSDFASGGGFGVRTVDSVGVDRLGEVSTDGTGSSFFRVGGAHQLTVASDGVFAFQNLNDNRTGSHERNQFTEEATLAVLGVEAFGFCL